MTCVCKTFYLGAIVPMLILGCGRVETDDRTTGSDFNPVYPEMLVGCQYSGRTGGSRYDDLQWTFDESSFEIIAGADGMPGDLAVTLLPPSTTADRIKGLWKVDGEVLTLFEISADEILIEQDPIEIATFCTPVIRIQPQSAQYMFSSGVNVRGNPALPNDAMQSQPVSE